MWNFYPKNVKCPMFCLIGIKTHLEVRSVCNNLPIRHKISLHRSGSHFLLFWGPKHQNFIFFTSENVSKMWFYTSLGLLKYFLSKFFFKFFHPSWYLIGYVMLLLESSVIIPNWQIIFTRTLWLTFVGNFQM